MPTDKPLQLEITPENVLDSWRDWSVELRSRPVILGSLSGGRSNRSFLLDSDDTRMVLRLNGPDSLLPGPGRSYEISTWQAASQQGIAPPLLHADEQNRFLVSTYIQNDLPPQPPHDEVFVEQALKLLERCHQLNVDAPSIDYRRHIDRYWQIIESKHQIANTNLVKQRKPMYATLSALINSNTTAALCHHDPVIANFVGNPDRLYLIDWEYAANGLPIMDYAALAAEWKLDDAVILDRTRFKSESLARAKALYEYFCCLWGEATI